MHLANSLMTSHISPSGGPIVRRSNGAILGPCPCVTRCFQPSSQLSVKAAFHSSRPEETLIRSLPQPLERVRLHKNILDKVDLKLVQSLLVLSSSALVISTSDASTTAIIPLQLPSSNHCDTSLIKDLPFCYQTKNDIC